MKKGELATLLGGAVVLGAIAPNIGMAIVYGLVWGLTNWVFWNVVMEDML